MITAERGDKSIKGVYYIVTSMVIDFYNND